MPTLPSGRSKLNFPCLSVRVLIVVPWTVTSAPATERPSRKSTTFPARRPFRCAWASRGSKRTNTQKRKKYFRAPGEIRPDLFISCPSLTLCSSYRSLLKMHFFRFATGCVDIISENGVTVYNFYNLSIITYLQRVQPARGGRRGGLKAFRRFKSARNWRNRKSAVKNI